MLTINEILKYNFKKIGVGKTTKGNETYDVEMSDKVSGKVIEPILRSVSKTEWDLNFMVIRLYVEELLNQTQYEDLLSAIEDYGQEKYEEGGNDGY